jgi:hypothetical protein
MSSQPSLIDFLLSIQKKLYEFGGLTLMICGTISCIFNLMVFTRRKTRKRPSSIYFVALEISNFLYIYSSFFLIALEYGYNINLATSNLVCCRLSMYASFLFDILISFCLIMASIDRILITSSNFLIRRRSTRRLAHIIIISGILFWMLFHIHALFFVNILPIELNTLICFFSPGSYLAFVGYYTLIKSILIPLLIIFLGLWAIKNIRQFRRVRPTPVSSVAGNRNRTRLSTTILAHNRLLGRILFMDTIAYVLFRLPIGFFLMYDQITQNYMRNSEQRQIELFIRLVFTFSAFIPSSIGCYLNLFISKTFRKEIKNIILCK